MTRLALVLSLVGSFWLASRTDAAESKPNVLFIAIDDLNDWVGVLGGHPQSRTPNVDRVAKMGMLFVRAYCAAPACNPSRTALLTGLRPSTSGVYHNNQPWRKALPDAVTLMQYFMKHGYRVMGGGKILHGRFREPSGWHEYHRPRNKYTKRDLPPNGIGGNMMWGPLEVDDAAMLDTDLTDWAIGKLKQKYEKPFFLAVGYYKPHLAWHAPKKYFEKHPQSKVKLPKVLEGDLDDIPQPGKRMARPQGDHRKILKKGVWKEAVQAYLATSTYMDHQLGRLLDTFLASPYAKNTIVVLWSDHGWNLGEKQHWRKFALWENTNHVPMAFVVPGMTRRGQVCRRPVNLLDIYPTLVELCGLPRQKQLEGNSLVPLLKNPKAEWKHASLSTHGRNNHSVRTERWRYIRYADGSEELYDHDKDPEEWKNLASDPKYAETKKTLKEHLPEKNVENATKIDTRRKSKKRGRPKGRAWLVDPTEVVDEVASHRAAWGRVFVRRKRLESIEGRFLVGFSLDVLLGLEADACGDGDFDEPDAAPKDEKADKREGDCLQDQGISGDEKALDAFVEDPQTDQYQQPSEKLTQPKADHSTLRRSKVNQYRVDYCFASDAFAAESDQQTMRLLRELHVMSQEAKPVAGRGPLLGSMDFDDNRFGDQQVDAVVDLDVAVAVGELEVGVDVEAGVAQGVSELFLVAGGVVGSESTSHFLGTRGDSTDDRGHGYGHSVLAQRQAVSINRDIFGVSAATVAGSTGRVRIR